MRLSLRSLRAFFADTKGAISVDYVVLTAAATGLALSAHDLIFDGYRALADNVNSELSVAPTTGETEEDENGEPVVNTVGISSSDNFSNGAPGWQGIDATDVAGLGSVLGPIAGSGGAQSASKEFHIQDGVAEATFEFDMYALDSLDGESGYIFVDGVEVGRLYKDNNDTIFFTGTDVDGLTITGTVVEQNVSLGGNLGTNHNWVDSRATIEITVENPDEYVSIGFGSDADQNTDNESFAVDNFNATGLHDPSSGNV